MPNFDFYNLSFVRSDYAKHLVIKGEIKNNSGRNYNAVAIRVILFNNNIPVVNIVVVVNGLPQGITKNFDKPVEEIDYDKIANKITRCETSVESAY